MPSRPHALVALWRGLIRQCPRCGQGRLFARWFTMLDRCPRCRLPFERGEGYWLGSMAVNLGATEAVFGAMFVGGMLLTWPDVPWTPLIAGSVALNIVFPIVFYPFSKTIFLAFDLILLHPERGEDAEG